MIVFIWALQTEFDEGFKEMLKSGKIRKCPKCDFAHMKDKGLCNVLQCGKCKIWWNWRSREMHNTQKGLKEIARRNRTLWEPGELEYQMKLERYSIYFIHQLGNRCDAIICRSIFTGMILQLFVICWSRTELNMTPIIVVVDTEQSILDSLFAFDDYL